MQPQEDVHVNLGEVASKVRDADAALNALKEVENQYSDQAEKLE